MASFTAGAGAANNNPNKSLEVNPAPGDSVSSLSFSPKANHLVATSWDNQVRCWEIQPGGQCQAKASISHDQPVLCSAWKDDGTTVFSGGCDKQIKMWPLLSGGQPTVLSGHEAPVKELAWIPQMNLLVSGSWDKTLRYWDVRQPQPAHVQQLPERCYALSLSYPLMVVGTADRNVIVFNMQNPQAEFKRIVSPLKLQTRCLAAFPDQQGFLVGSIEGRVGVHHVDDGQQGKNFTFKCHRDGNDIYAVNALNFHPVHHTFATSGSDGGFNFWDKDSKQRLKEEAKHPPVNGSAMAFSLDDLQCQILDIDGGVALPSSDLIFLPASCSSGRTTWASSTQAESGCTLKKASCKQAASRTSSHELAFNKCPSPITCSTFNQDGSIFAYAVCYDWSKGAEKHNPSTAKTNIFLHSVQESEVKGKPRVNKK
uniref:Uncharacterized protein n=1 Tax=Oryza punctata TaxID=4537 RepID=A0A0E0JLJ2_ORYPU